MTDIIPSESGLPHRKAWEFAIGIQALREAGVLHDDANGLSVGAGHEAILYYLANHSGQIIATDLYGAGAFAGREAATTMLSDPDLFAPYPYRRGRLMVMHMDALDLRFEDDTFDYSVSFGSVEHIGGYDGARGAVAEMARVTRPGGVVFVTTELAADGGPDAAAGPTELFAPETLLRLAESIPELEWLDEVDLRPPSEPEVPVIDLGTQIGLLEIGEGIYPHIRLATQVDTGEVREFRSVSLAFRKRTG
jgi:SAM-dependent methyltransferase